MSKRIIAAFLMLILTAPVSKAQEVSGSFDGGSVKVGYDNRTCSGALEGAVRYNSSTQKIEFCDSSAWISPGGCTAPALCPNIGDICDDSNGGTTHDPIFAGFMVYGVAGGCEALYVTDDNQSSSVQWRTSSAWNEIPDPPEWVDGQYNDSQISNSATWPAMKLCKDLTDGGFTDWYLPAMNELDLLRINRTAIDANAVNPFITTFQYWSSTEEGGASSYAWGLQFSANQSADGMRDSYNKDESYRVRCVRRD